MLLGNKNDVDVQWKNVLKKFDGMKEGEMKEYVGCKMVCNQVKRSLKMMKTN